VKSAGCRAIGIDKYPPVDIANLDEFILHDLDETPFPRTLEDVDVVLLLDVIEHLRSPESFVTALRDAAVPGRSVRIVVSTGNVGFLVPRLMLIFGQFNYGKRGILDLTHTRLFTFASLRRLLEESGFAVESVRGIPAPVPLVVHNRFLAGLLMRLNKLLIAISRTLFAYQIYMTVRPLPTLETLLSASHSHTRARAEAMLQSLAEVR
jgi:hypothetical protein